MKSILTIVFVCFSSFVFSAKLQLSLTHLIGDEALALMEKKYTSSSNDEISINKLKYYIGGIVLTYKSGEQYVDKVNYHLIDIDDPNSLLIEIDNVLEGIITEISFGIGVDSLTNNQGLMDGDLDPMNGMYWAWSSGFINFKLEGECYSCGTTNEFNYHIGGFIAPNQSYQTTKLNLNKSIIKETEQLELFVDIGILFKDFEVSSLYKIMSPSLKSKEYSERLPAMFSFKK